MTSIEVRQTDAFTRWFNRLRDDRARDRIQVRIRRLALGNPGDVRTVGSRVFEMRIHYGPGYRIYFTTREPTVVVLLAGGDKQSQTTDIAQAQALESLL